MSIYHRYAMLYNLQRYLADVERLCTIASQCHVVEDKPAPGATKLADLSTYKHIYVDPKAEPALRGGEELRRRLEALHSLEEWDDCDPSENKENRNDYEVFLEHFERAMRGQEDGQNQDKGGGVDDAVPDAQLDGRHSRGPEDKGATDGAAGHDGAYKTLADHDHTADDGGDDDDDDKTAVGTEHDYSKCSIRRSQLNRVLACERMVCRLEEVLLRNIRRTEAEANSLSARTIRFFWQEAARLNGAAKIRSLRAVERETATGSWDDDHAGRSGEAGTWSAGDAQRAGSPPVVGTSSPFPSSPLCRTVDPEDLFWEGQVEQWQLDLGRPVDDQGRRHVKM